MDRREGGNQLVCPLKTIIKMDRWSPLLDPPAPQGHGIHKTWLHSKGLSSLPGARSLVYVWTLLHVLSSRLIEGSSTVEREATHPTSALMNRVIDARWRFCAQHLLGSPHVESDLTTGSPTSHQSKLPSLVPRLALIGPHRSRWAPIGGWPHVGRVRWLRAYLCEDWLQQMARLERSPECAGKMGKCMVGCMALNKSTKM